MTDLPEPCNGCHLLEKCFREKLIGERMKLYEFTRHASADVPDIFSITYFAEEIKRHESCNIHNLPTEIEYVRNRNMYRLTSKWMRCEKTGRMHQNNPISTRAFYWSKERRDD